MKRSVVIELDTEMHFDLEAELRFAEIVMIEAALLAGGGVKARAAKVLGLNRTTLVMKMKAHGMKLKKPLGARA